MKKKSPKLCRRALGKIKKEIDNNKLYGWFFTLFNIYR